MRKIIVHTGYVPSHALKNAKSLIPKGTPAQLVMLTPEINIVNQTNKLLDNMNNEEVLEIATNNIVAVYTIRTYIVKHSNNYDVEYRYYTIEDYKSNNPSKYQLIKQGDHGDFINPPEGFFDTIDNLLNQMLSLE